MIIKFDIDSEFFKKIQGLIDAEKYENIHQFIKIALTNQLQEEISFEETPQDDELSLIEDTELQKSESSSKKYDDKFKEIKIDYSDVLKPQEHEIIWSFYNRFLPVKITITTLADLISIDKPWIEIEDLQEAALKSAQTISEKIKNYEDENGLTRNKKLSTGLPLSKTELHGIKK